MKIRYWLGLCVLICFRNRTKASIICDSTWPRVVLLKFSKLHKPSGDSNLRTLKHITSDYKSHIGQAVREIMYL